MFTPSVFDSPATPFLKRVAIVGGSAELLAWLEPMLDPGNYEVLFLDAGEAPYSQIRLAQPDLIVLTVRIEDVGAFGLLSMLKMDDETSRIPVITYTTEYEGQPLRCVLGDLADEPAAATRPALPLN